MNENNTPEAILDESFLLKFEINFDSISAAGAIDKRMLVSLDVMQKDFDQFAKKRWEAFNLHPHRPSFGHYTPEAVVMNTICMSFADPMSESRQGCIPMLLFAYFLKNQEKWPVNSDEEIVIDLIELAKSYGSSQKDIDDFVDEFCKPQVILRDINTGSMDVIKDKFPAHIQNKINELINSCDGTKVVKVVGDKVELVDKEQVDEALGEGAYDNVMKMCEIESQIMQSSTHEAPKQIH